MRERVKRERKREKERERERKREKEREKERERERKKERRWPRWKKVNDDGRNFYILKCKEGRNMKSQRSFDEVIYENIKKKI
jgi:hypothetical protein